MKTLKKIGLVLAALLSLSMVVGCATFGMSEVEDSSFFTAETVTGTWNYSTKGQTNDASGSTTKDKSGEIEFSGLTASTFAALLNGYVTDSHSSVYVNSKDKVTKIVIVTDVYNSSTGKKTSSSTTTYTKQKK